MLQITAVNHMRVYNDERIRCQVTIYQMKFTNSKTVFHWNNEWMQLEADNWM